MARPLTAEDLLAGANVQHAVEIPATLLPKGATAGSVVLRPLAVRDIQRVTQAAREQAALTSVLIVQQALVQEALG